MAKKNTVKFLTYKGKPLVRSGNTIYYGNMSDPYVIMLSITSTKKFNDMEEKKTKKMTKAEAFEYLKGKKVACDGSNNEAVHRKLFELGIRWLSDCGILRNVPFLFINPYGMTYCDTREFFDLHENKEISADDILSIEIVEEKKEESENINIDIEKWVEIVRNKYCRHGWSFVISESNYGLIKGDLIEEKSKR